MNINAKKCKVVFVMYQCKITINNTTILHGLTLHTVELAFIFTNLNIITKKKCMLFNETFWVDTVVFLTILQGIEVVVRLLSIIYVKHTSLIYRWFPFATPGLYDHLKSLSGYTIIGIDFWPVMTIWYTFIY